MWHTSGRSESKFVIAFRETPYIIVYNSGNRENGGKNRASPTEDESMLAVWFLPTGHSGFLYKNTVQRAVPFSGLQYGAVIRLGPNAFCTDEQHLCRWRDCRMTGIYDNRNRWSWFRFDSSLGNLHSQTLLGACQSSPNLNSNIQILGTRLKCLVEECAFLHHNSLGTQSQHFRDLRHCCNNRMQFH